MNTVLYCTAVIKLVAGHKTDAMRAMIYSIQSAWSIVRKCLFVNLFFRLTKTFSNQKKKTKSKLQTSMCTIQML